MSENQRDTAFLRQAILYDDTAERQALDERITQDQRNERCVRRAVSLVALLSALALAGLCYSEVLLADSPQNKFRFSIKVFAAVGLGSVICLPVFLSFWIICRRKVEQRREECRRLATRLLEARLGKPSNFTS